MNIAKACQNDDIPTKMIRMNKDIFTSFIAKDFHNCSDEGIFPDELKHAKVYQTGKNFVFLFIKRKTKVIRSDRTVSILPNIAK